MEISHGLIIKQPGQSKENIMPGRDTAKLKVTLNIWNILKKGTE